MSHEGWLAVGVAGNVATADVGGREATDVETNVVAGLGLVNHGVVHLDGLHFTALGRGVEDHVLADVERTGFDLANGHGTDTGDLVDVLDGQPERLVGWLVGHGRSVDGLKEICKLDFLKLLHNKKL